jgi:hypothetical protein
MVYYLQNDFILPLVYPSHSRYLEGLGSDLGKLDPRAISEAAQLTHLGGAALCQYDKYGI